MKIYLIEKLYIKIVNHKQIKLHDSNGFQTGQTQVTCFHMFVHESNVFTDDEKNIWSTFVQT